MSKFQNVQIDQLTESECRELLTKIQKLAHEMPSMIDWNLNCYSCCGASDEKWHSKDCPIGEFHNIFGY
jgi:hypothetical protein